MSIQAIKRVEEGYFLDETIDYYFSRHKLTETQKGLIYEIVSGVVRWKGYLDWVLSQYIQKKVKNDIQYLIWVSLYQISFMKKAKYHIVNESVEHAKSEHGRNVANFVNAVLRKFIREQDSISHSLRTDMKAIGNSQSAWYNPAEGGTIGNRYATIPPKVEQSEIGILSIVNSFPEWLVERWLKRFGHDETERLLAILNKPPEFGIRVNLNKIARDTVIHRLEEKGIRVKKGQFLEPALSVDKLSPVLNDELFKKGFFHIQDEVSQLACSSIRQERGDFILDACAGLGRKTKQLKEQLDGPTIVAMDIEMKRLKLIPDTIDLVKGDATRSPFKEGSFSAIILDAPCSSLGIIRKHPEIKWRRKEKDIAGFGEYQFNLLKSLWKTLKPGGHMVYSVCSFEPEETVSVIERFKKEETFILENPHPFLFNKEYFLSLPHETGMDGFFIARLKKI